MTAATHSQARQSTAPIITTCYQGSRALSIVNGRDQCPTGAEVQIPSWRAFMALRLRPAGVTGAPGATGPAGATGATGAISPAGPIGPMGPAGATGRAGASGDTIVYAAGARTTAGGVTTVTATCPTGDTITGGGDDIPSQVPLGLTGSVDGPTDSSNLLPPPVPQPSWTVTIGYTSAAAGDLYVYGFCIPAP
ncbi:MAG TPA: hypothetical protein VMW47_01570 [Verrucomicrobiae bacterium]|nr:hypothetical protein [Verrucomicrobiae bacterium]